MEETIPEEVRRDYAKAFGEYIPPCPWNPFPRETAWGAEIERQWQGQQRAERRRRRIATSIRSGV